jgi:predicted permease
MSLDFKLGFRMLVKYPGLTIVGGLAMSFGIWVGTLSFVAASMAFHPTLPLPDGDRIVLLRNWDVSALSAEPRALGDFVVWRRALKSINDIGAYRDVTRNVITGTDDARPVQVAEMTASGFQVSSGRPLLGRVLSTADEAPGAPPVVVLGYELWRTRFAGDGAIVGKTVKVGDTFATVVGVMPERFEFPVSHDLWMPLRWQAADEAPRAGPAITMFGRLAPGADLESAQSELTTIGKRAAVDRRATHEHLEPQVGAYAKQFQNGGASDFLAMASIPTFAAMLVALICGNVALLLFARAATRETELVVRSALGATRRRIVAQLFAEALVLGGLSAVIGVSVTQLTLDRFALPFLEANFGRVPFWIDPHLSTGTVVYAVGLTIVAAVVAGVMPALKITRGLSSRLKQNTGGGGIRFSGVWTVVIVAQVAMTVAFPAIVAFERSQSRYVRDFPAGFPAEKFVAVTLAMDAPKSAAGDSAAARTELRAQQARYGATLEAIRQRVAAEPGVAGVTFVEFMPRTWHDHYRVEVDAADMTLNRAAGAAPAPSQNLRPIVSIAGIDPSYFSVLETPVLAGRSFDLRDLAPGVRTAIVDKGFVDQVLQGRNAVGLRLRFKANQGPRPLPGEEERPWFQIVGVVKELGMGSPMDKDRASGVYLATAPEKLDSVYMMVHAKGADPLSVVPRIRSIAAAVDPTLRLSGIQRVSEVSDVLLWLLGLWTKLSMLLTGIALLLSLAGIYAVLSFIVARRTREIGVRVALGASQRRIIVAIFRRPLIQVASGVAVGGILIALAAEALAHSEMSNAGTGFSLALLAQLIAYGSLMFGVCLLACIVPTRRALSVEPTESLRAE